jgi:hypothetical protein
MDVWVPYLSSKFRQIPALPADREGNLRVRGHRLLVASLVALWIGHVCRLAQRGEVIRSGIRDGVGQRHSIGHGLCSSGIWGSIRMGIRHRVVVMGVLPRSVRSRRRSSSVVGHAVHVGGGSPAGVQGELASEGQGRQREGRREGRRGGQRGRHV